MKKILAFLLLGAMLFSANVSSAEERMGLNYTINLFDKYAGWPGIRVDANPSLTNELVLNYKGVSFGTWIAAPLEGKLNDGFNNEVDFFLAYDLSRKYFNLHLDAQIFMLHDLNQTDDDQGALSLRIDLKHWPLNPFFGFRDYLEVGKDSPERGLFWYAGLTRSQPVFKSTVNIEAAVRWSDGPLGSDSGISSIRFSAVAPIKVRDLLPIGFLEKAELLPSFMWQVAIDRSPNSLARDDVRVGIGIRIPLR